MMASVGKVGSSPRYKITVMGDQYVGKTSIIRRYVRNEFSPTYINTAGKLFFLMISSFLFSPFCFILPFLSFDFVSFFSQ